MPGYNLAEVTIHFQLIGCRFMACLSSLPYSADGGGGAAALVITENCCVGGNRCVNSAMTEKREKGVCLATKCALGLT